MKKLAFLEYAFLFNPGESWSNIYDFDKDLNKVFRSLGYEARILDTVGGYEGRKVIYITRIVDELNKPTKKERLQGKK